MDHPARRGRHFRVPNPPSFGPSFARLFWGNFLLYALGFWGAWKLATLAGGFVEQFTGGGHYSLEWRGAPVKYSFFSQLIFPSLCFCVLAALYRKSMVRWAAVALMAIYPLATVVFLGRRAMAAFLGLSLLLSLWFARKIALPRWLFASLLVLVGIAVLVGDQYRTSAQFSLSKEVLKETRIKSAVGETVKGEKPSEFDFLVVGSAAIQRELRFGFGTGFYNSTAAQVIPSQWVGQNVKESLYWKLVPDDITEKAFGWTVPYGSNPTGPLNAFSDFWLFGCVLYYGMARFFRWLWHRAASGGDLSCQYWYILLAGTIPMSIYGSLFVIPGYILPLAVFFGAVLYFARQKSERNAAASGRRSWVPARRGVRTVPKRGRAFDNGDFKTKRRGRFPPARPVSLG